MQYASKIIGFVLLEKSLFPMYIAGSEIPCSTCDHKISAGDTFTRDDNQRKPRCKVCRLITGQKFIKPDGVKVDVFRDSIMPAVYAQLRKATLQSAIDECSQLMLAAGYASSAQRIYWPGVKCFSMIRTAVFYLERTKKRFEANRLRELANTFLEVKI